MFSALVILLILPFTNFSQLRNLQFRPLGKSIFFIFVVNFVLLMILGSKHVESPYIELGQICTVLYFGYFLVLMPSVTLIENYLSNIASSASADK